MLKTSSGPPHYFWYDYIRILWAGRRWRHSPWSKSKYLANCKCRWCRLYFKAKKELRGRDVNPVGGGGGGGSFTIRCASCKASISGGICINCGPYAAVEYVSAPGYRLTCAVCGVGISSGLVCPNRCAATASINFAPGGVMTGGSRGAAVVPCTCVSCATPIPSGTCCSVACLFQYMPSLYIPSAGGCLDCGSGLAPTYHAGCMQAGRVTSYLPTPGPYGSNGLTQAQAAPPKKPIPVAGMQGYSEHGTPDDWDMAIGTIRGYRWFKIEIPESWAGVRSLSLGKKGYYDVTGKPDLQDSGMLELDDDEIPSLFGAYGGEWHDGVNEARCRRSISTRPGGGFHHEPPEIREACGCGFWAYFDENLRCDSVLSQWTQARAGMTGIAVLGCIEGSGRVIVGEKGFRSQYAKITALAVGQISVPGLMWWVQTARDRDSFGNSYTVAPGMGASGFKDFLRGSGYDTDSRVQCSDEELYVRLAKIEDMLSRKYPGARIMSSETTLRGFFPPDENYRSK